MCFYDQILGFESIIGDKISYLVCLCLSFFMRSVCLFSVGTLFTSVSTLHDLQLKTQYKIKIIGNEIGKKPLENISQTA